MASEVNVCWKGGDLMTEQLSEQVTEGEKQGMKAGANRSMSCLSDRQ